MSKELEALIDKKRWELAIPQLIANVDKNLFPTDIVMAQVFNDCILKFRRTSAKANELLEKIVQTKKNVDSYEFVLQAVASVSAVSFIINSLIISVSVPFNYFHLLLGIG
jgi:hypothetical protein